MSKATAVQAADHQVVIYKSRAGQQVQLSLAIVRDFLVTGKKELVTDQEIVLYMGICRSLGMDPFAKDVYLVKFDQNPAAPIVAIDFYRSRARAQEDCRGWQKGVICLQKDGTLRYSNGLVLPTEELVGGWFEAQPTGWEMPFKLEVNLSGYTKDNAFWKPAKAPTMIAKVAESQGLRTLWPKEFKGTLVAEEIGELSEALTGGEIHQVGSTSGPTPEPPDTSEFKSLVETQLKDLSEEDAKVRIMHLGQYLKETAERMTTKKATVTTDMLMVNAAAYFLPYVDKNKTHQLGFWKKFLLWEESPERPWFETGQAEKAPVVEPGAEAGPAEKAEAGAAAGDGEGEWPPAAAGEEEAFEARAGRLWNLVVDKSPPVKTMKDACGVTNRNSIAPENIDALEKFIVGYEKKK